MNHWENLLFCSNESASNDKNLVPPQRRGRDCLYTTAHRRLSLCHIQICFYWRIREYFTPTLFKLVCEEDFCHQEKVIYQQYWPINDAWCAGEIVEERWRISPTQFPLKCQVQSLLNFTSLYSSRTLMCKNDTVIFKEWHILLMWTGELFKVFYKVTYFNWE